MKWLYYSLMLWIVGRLLLNSPGYWRSCRTAVNGTWTRFQRRMRNWSTRKWCELPPILSNGQDWCNFEIVWKGFNNLLIYFSFGHVSASYCVVAACDVTDDHTEVALSTDDYLWVKLCQLKDDENISHDLTHERLTYSQFQTLVLEEYGMLISFTSFPVQFLRLNVSLCDQVNAISKPIKSRSCTSKYCSSRASLRRPSTSLPALKDSAVIRSTWPWLCSRTACWPFQPMCKLH